jgi:tRNA modification GTPase
VQDETIAAIATGGVSGSISVIRVSGREAIAISQKVFKTDSGVLLKDIQGYTAKYGRVYKDNKMLDEAIALIFRAPRSYTGEDVVEIFCHGGVFVTRQVLESLFYCGAVPPGPGEFTKRAYLNGKMGLMKAESVMNIISAQGKQSLNAAFSISEGRVYKKIQSIKQSLIHIAAQFSASCDEEDISEIESCDIKKKLNPIKNDLFTLVSNYERGKIIREGLRTAIIGCPNVGKSTLMNLLTKFERSIVTDVAGTTRDTIEENIRINDVVLRLVDTAGIRETSNKIEKIGVEKAEKEQKSADFILAVFDSSREFCAEDIKILNSLKNNLAIAIINKIDLPCKIDKKIITSSVPYCLEISLSNDDCANILEGKILEVVDDFEIDSNQEFLANQRQLCAARSALSNVELALKNLNDGLALDMVFVCIEEAIEKICELTGENIKDSVLDEVFSKFCIGK